MTDDQVLPLKKEEGTSHDALLQSQYNPKPGAAKKWVSHLNRWHEAVCDDAHAQEHVDERYKVNDGPGHFVPDRRVLGVPHRQHHSWNHNEIKTEKIGTWESVYSKENVLNDLLSASTPNLLWFIVWLSGRTDWMEL